jgi:hypothetical protein
MMLRAGNRREAVSARTRPRVLCISEKDPHVLQQASVRSLPGVPGGRFDPLGNGIRPVSHGEVAPVIALWVQRVGPERRDLWGQTWQWVRAQLGARPAEIVQAS